MSSLATLLRKHRKRADAAPESPLTPSAMVLPDDGEKYTSVGTKGLLAATSKLLAVNRGLVPTDDRDSWAFKRVMTPDKLLAERIRMDASQGRRAAVRRASKQRSLKGVFPFAFDNDARGLLIGNPLSSPLEEINPASLVESARRVTMMGPGGIGSDQAITPAMQMIHASQFGFISGLEGPECTRLLSEVRVERGWVQWADVRADDNFAGWWDNRPVWVPAERIVRQPYSGEMICARYGDFAMCVTPNHRVYGSLDHQAMESVTPAEKAFGRHVTVRTCPNHTEPMPEWSLDWRASQMGLPETCWSREFYEGEVCCATVPGGQLLLREEPGKLAYWSGNSERAGVDARLSWGVKFGSDGRLYQRFKDNKTGKMTWLSPADLEGRVVGLPR